MRQVSFIIVKKFTHVAQFQKQKKSLLSWLSEIGYQPCGAVHCLLRQLFGCRDRYCSVGTSGGSSSLNWCVPVFSQCFSSVQSSFLITSVDLHVWPMAIHFRGLPSYVLSRGHGEANSTFSSAFFIFESRCLLLFHNRLIDAVTLKDELLWAWMRFRRLAVAWLLSQSHVVVVLFSVSLSLACHFARQIHNTLFPCTKVRSARALCLFECHIPLFFFCLPVLSPLISTGKSLMRHQTTQCKCQTW